MTDVQLMLVALRGLRHALLSVVDQIDTVLELADRPSEKKQPADGACDHPQRFRKHRGTMGHPTRFFCDKCKTEVEE